MDQIGSQILPASYTKLDFRKGACPRFTVMSILCWRWEKASAQKSFMNASLRRFFARGCSDRRMFKPTFGPCPNFGGYKVQTIRAGIGRTAVGLDACPFNRLETATLGQKNVTACITIDAVIKNFLYTRRG